MIRYTQMFGKEWRHDHKNFTERKVNMDRNAPIGVFDSGIGGLTVAREIMRQMPQERIVYFGDTARVIWKQIAGDGAALIPARSSVF